MIEVVIILLLYAVVLNVKINDTPVGCTLWAI